jgi:hypothetical protein
MPLRQDPIPDLITPELSAAITRTISPERWRTYQLATGFNEQTAHKLYLWNVAVGQSFHFPLQTVEVALRNVIHHVLTDIYGPNWTQAPAFRATLTPDRVNDILKAERRHYRIYEAAPTTPQILASLSLGFWVTLLRREFNRTLWNSHSGMAFPHLDASESIADVSQTGTDIQSLRNRIFHQEPLIGHDLSLHYASILRMIGWICPEMRNWTRSLSSVPRVLRERPR